jgi:drug/metabolite transporter (DMT)-like permease
VNAAPLAGFVTVVLWGSAFVGIRSAGHAFSPGALTLGRLLVALVALGVISALRGERLPSRAQLRVAGPALLVCGLLWFGAYNLTLNAGERRVDAGTAAMLTNVGPVLIAILAGLLLKEGFPRTLFAGCATAFAGVALIALSGAQTIFLCCAIGAGVCLPFVAQLAHELGSAPAGSIGWLVYLGLFPTAVGFSTWAYALSRTDAGRTAALTYLVPPVSILLGWALLGETPERLAYAGGALCLVGVWWARRQPKPAALEPAEA